MSVVSCWSVCSVVVCLFGFYISLPPTYSFTASKRRSHDSNKPVLIVVSYDGFRNEYLERGATPNMLKFREEGVFADYLINVYPTNTFPNHHSIATGLYPDKHGVLGNSLYDTEERRVIQLYELFHYNDSILPIWTINELAGGRSGCMMWPGSDFDYRGIRCSHLQVYNPKVPLVDRVNTVMEWISDPVKPSNLIMFYSEQPDKLSHAEGPDSEKVTSMVAALDYMVKYIQDQLVERQLIDRVNVIYLSDHGMVAVRPSNIINLTDYLEDGTYEMYGSSPVVQVIPLGDHLDDVYQRLKKASEFDGNFDVYKTENLPVHWHALNPRRFGPIIAVAQIPYAFQDMWKYAKPNNGASGVHGFDIKEPLMHPIFMAKGPSIRSGVKVEPFETVDLFILFTRLLGIRDIVSGTDGIPSRVANVLKTSGQINNN